MSIDPPFSFVRLAFGRLLSLVLVNGMPLVGMIMIPSKNMLVAMLLYLKVPSRAL